MKDIGFVYEWLDLSNGKKYIGSHKGTPDDGYTGSGKIFKSKYKARPDDFYRFIRYCGPNYREAEELLLNSVDAANNDEYYNLKNEAGGWTTETSKKAVEIAINSGKIGGHKTGPWLYKNKKGIWAMSEEERFKANSKGGKIGGKKSAELNYKNKTGLWGMSEEEKFNARSKGGITSGNNHYKNKTGLWGMSEMEKHNRNIKGAKRAAKKLSKPVLVYDINTNKVIGKYSSMTEASEKLNIRRSYIRECANGMRNHWNGYTFKYKNSDS